MTQPKRENLTHHAAHRWWLCPGSVWEAPKHPKGERHPDAIEGVYAHALFETGTGAKVLSGGGRVDLHGEVGSTLSSDDGDFVITEEQVERVQFAVNQIEIGEEDRVFLEHDVDPQWLLGRTDQKGRADVLIWRADGLLEIIDYKDGMHPVPAKDNQQLELGLFGALSELKLATNVEWPVTRVRMTILQPNLRKTGRSGVSTHEMPVSELLDKIPEYAIRAAATDDPNAPLLPGPEQCRYCPAKNSCKEKTDHVLVTMGATDLEAEASQQVADVNPNMLSDDRIREVLEAAPLIRKTLESIEEEGLRRLKEGRAIEGVKVVKGAGNRKWSESEDEVEAALRRAGVPKALCRSQKLVSITQLGKLRWTKKKAGEEVTAQLSKKQLENLEAKYITRGEGSFKLVLDSDEREAVIFDASPMFGAVKPESLGAVPDVPETPALPDWLA